MGLRRSAGSRSESEEVMRTRRKVRAKKRDKEKRQKNDKEKREKETGMCATVNCLIRVTVSVQGPVTGLEKPDLLM